MVLPTRRVPRSRDGCLTCRRRKVRCNEQHPRCSHCERLNLECKWRTSSGGTALQRKHDASIHQSASGSTTPGRISQQSSNATVQALGPSENAMPAISMGQSSQHLGQIFDYASFMWDSVDLWQQQWPSNGLDWRADSGVQPQSTAFPQSPHTILPTSSHLSPPNSGDVVTQTNISESIARSDTFDSNNDDFGPQFQDRDTRWGLSQTITTSSSAPHSSTAEEALLLNYFIRSAVPPILAEVETQQKWSTMLQILISMSNASAMVKYAIIAFASLLLRRREGSSLPNAQDYYARALEQLGDSAEEEKPTSGGTACEYRLAAIFFLSYIDILEGRMSAAHQHLKNAYTMFRQRDKKWFRAIELRLISWIRLLDGRAVSAGGEGLFLSDDDDVIVQPSPSSLRSENDTRLEETPDDEVEDVLFQLLYQPGIVFFQRVQSFMGRISKIDLWHRSRGTVEDETQVMNIAAAITKDLNALYDNRPLLMDLAVTGKLTAAHVSAGLAFAITRAFRMYASNFYASRVHLHRVAYKTLPLTTQATEALRSIKNLAKLMVDDLEEHDSLPVNMLWPLLMLGSEEQVPVEREWIEAQILRMEKVATNARLTVSVLREVQARQDATKTRADIRTVMHAIFDSCFAIL